MEILMSARSIYGSKKEQQSRDDVALTDIVSPAPAIQLCQIIKANLDGRAKFSVLPLWHWLYCRDLAPLGRAETRPILVRGTVRLRAPIPLFSMIRKVSQAARPLSGSAATEYYMAIDDKCVLEATEGWGEPKCSEQLPKDRVTASRTTVVSGMEAVAFAALTMDVQPRYLDSSWRGSRVTARWIPTKLLAILLLEHFRAERPNREVIDVEYELHHPIFEEAPFTLALGEGVGQNRLWITDADGRLTMSATVRSVL
jgi:hypothetical protein